MHRFISSFNTSGDLDAIGPVFVSELAWQLGQKFLQAKEGHSRNDGTALSFHLVDAVLLELGLVIWLIEHSLNRDMTMHIVLGLTIDNVGELERWRHCLSVNYLTVHVFVLKEDLHLMDNWVLHRRGLDGKNEFRNFKKKI